MSLKGSTLKFAHMSGVIDSWNLGCSGWNHGTDVESFESILSIGNGRFGQRANFEEGFSGTSLRGSYLGGVYYPDKTKVGWWKNGYPEFFAKVLNSTNWIDIGVKVNGEVLDLYTAKSVDHFEWGMNMKEGVLRREFKLTMSNGSGVAVRAERFCSMAQPELGCLRYAIQAANCSVEVSSALDAAVKNEDSNWDDQFWSISAVESKGEGLASIEASTQKSDFGVCFSMWTGATIASNQGEFQRLLSGTSFKSDFKTGYVYAHDLKKGEWLEVEKYVGITTTVRHPKSKLRSLSDEHAARAQKTGWALNLEEHKAAWDSIWRQADIVIEGDVASQQAIRFNIFQLNQTYRGDDPRLNIGPKGFTGEKYGGASYWDTEAYCLPFYLAGHSASVARQLLLYRYRHLDKAIENAVKLGFDKGAALYPMVTMNGEECHNEWEITFEEIHRNGAMSYAIWNYVNYTGDEDYLRTNGFAVLLAVARFWQQRVQWSEHRKAYVMLGVTGPNEYENNVNNNWYTNYIAAWCMRYAREVADWIKVHHPADWERLSIEYAIDESHVFQDWVTIPDQMYFPRLEGTRVFLQQDGFLDKEQLTVADLPASERPINQKWSWDRILRSVFIKQADVLQGMYFFGGNFDTETLAENYDFYEPKTVHESSLSPCVHAILAARLGRMEEAYGHYLRTSRLDLDDYNKEVHEGLHITSMAGTWLSVVEGFGGFAVKNDKPHFNGQLPPAWSGLTFKINFRNRLLEVDIRGNQTTVDLCSGEALEVVINGKDTVLRPRH